MCCGGVRRAIISRRSLAYGIVSPELLASSCVACRPELILSPSHAFASQPDHDATIWILNQLPMNYALFEQVTHPKPEKPGAAPKANAPKKRLDRFVFGESRRRIALGHFSVETYLPA